MGNSFGKIYRITTFGESHAPALGVVVDNCPAGLKLKEADIQPDLDRRKPGQSDVSTPRKEDDQVEILSGTYKNITIGSPVAMIIRNKNIREQDYIKFKKSFRPSHADFTYEARYGYRATSGGGRASARTTVGIVASGAIAKKILRQAFNIEITAYVSSIYNFELNKEISLLSAKKLRKQAEANEIRCPDSSLAILMKNEIQKIQKTGDSLGGVINCKIENTPPGWGSPVFDRLDALLAGAMLAIPASKGVEFGSGFSGTKQTGSSHNDIFYNDQGKIKTHTNNSGGIQGGISNGMPIEFRIAFKPTATIAKAQTSLKKNLEETTLKIKGRHDPCVLPRAVPIVEAMAALVLVDQMLLAQVTRMDQLS